MNSWRLVANAQRAMGSRSVRSLGGDKPGLGPYWGRWGKGQRGRGKGKITGLVCIIVASPCVLMAVEVPALQFGGAGGGWKGSQQ